MLFLSIKTTKKRLVALLSLFLFCVVLLIGQTIIPDKEIKTVSANTALDLSAQTAEQRVAFLESLGWEVDKEPIEFSEVIIPSEFDQVYEKYNQIQKENGFDLSKYRTKRAKRYTYTVKNFPDQKEGVLANILIYNGKIIGGDISSVYLDGFMNGLKKQ